MGIGVTVYKNVHPFGVIGKDFLNEDIYEFEDTVITKNPQFDYDIELDPTLYYTGDYILSEHIGAYGFYNDFREQLCIVMFGISYKKYSEYNEDFDQKPFYPILYSSDCEGVVGPLFSKKLYRDFKNYRQLFFEKVDACFP